MDNKKPIITINKNDKEIIIQDLIIKNSEVFDFLKDKKNLEDWVTKALIIGCVGLKQMVLGENIDFVEKEFNKFLNKAKEVFEKQAEGINEKIDDTFSFENTESPLYQMKEIIEDYFDIKKGKFREIIDDYFNKDKGQVRKIIDDTFDLDNKKSALSRLIEEVKENSEMEEETIHELLDPNKTNSPAWHIKEQILEKLNDIKEKEMKELSEKITELKENEIKEIRDEVLKKSAIETERQKGTAKGIDFQDEVYEIIETLARPYEDKITPIGEKRGREGKKGDILIELRNKKNIIVECKDSFSYSCKKIMEEIHEAMENRKSSFGIFIFAKKEEMPKEFCPIKITEDYIITCYEKENIYLSYRLARILVLKEHEGVEEKIDFEKISNELNNIEEIIKNIDNMQAKVTNILNSGDYLRTNLKKLQNGIETSIEKIKKTLGGKFDDSAVDSNDDEVEKIEENEEIIEEKEDENSFSKLNENHSNEDKMKKLPKWMRVK